MQVCVNTMAMVMWRMTVTNMVLSVYVDSTGDPVGGCLGWCLLWVGARAGGCLLMYGSQQGRSCCGGEDEMQAEKDRSVHCPIDCRIQICTTKRSGVEQ